MGADDFIVEHFFSAVLFDHIHGLSGLGKEIEHHGVELLRVQAAPLFLVCFLQLLLHLLHFFERKVCHGQLLYSR